MLTILITYIILFFALLGTFKNPFVGVVAYYTLSFYRPQAVHWWALGDSHLSLYIAIATIISFFLKKQKRSIEPTERVSQDNLMIALWIAATLSTLFSLEIGRSWPTYINFSKVILFYFILSNTVTSKKKFEILIWVTILCFGRHAIWANHQYLTGVWGEPHGPGNVTGVLTDRNTLAMVFVTTIPFAFYFAMIKKNIFLRIVSAVILAFLVHGVLITQSRGGFLGMVAVLPLCLVKTPKKWLTVYFLILAIPIFFRYWGPSSRERIATVFVDAEERGTSAQGRIEAWKGGFGIIQSRPLFGVGFENYENYVQMYNEKLDLKRVAHNAFIQIGAEAGLPIMFLFSFLIFGSLWDLFQLTKYYRNKDPTLSHYSNMLLISLSGYTVCAVFLSVEMYEPLYFTIALTASLKKLKKNYI